MSVRDDPVLFLQSGKRTTSTGTVAGGSAITTTTPHKLDGAEHNAADDTTRLDATVDRHGLLPKLSSAASDALRGDGTWGPTPDLVAGLVPAGQLGTGADGSGTHVLFDDGAWRTIATGTGLGLPWFVVTDPTYGAVGDDTTDDRDAIQAAMNAARDAGGGVVYFPRRPYLVAGAMQDTGRGNAQLLAPSRLYAAGGAEQITIHLLGEVPPPAIPSVIGSVALPDNGPVLRSSIAAGTGAILGGWGPSGSLDDFTMVRLKVENLTFRTIANPTITWIDLSHIATVELVNVQTDPGEMNAAAISLQTTASSYGIRLPAVNDGASTLLVNVNVIGAYNGIEVGEHTVGDNVAVWACRNAYKFPAAYHASHFGRLAWYHCINGLFGVGTHYVSIDQINVEHAAGGTWAPGDDIHDGSNVLYGHGIWHVVKAGVGVDHTFTKVGGANFATLELGSSPFASGAPTTVDYLVGTASAGLSAEIVVGTTPGGELGGTWASPTVDSVHSGSAHSDYVARSVATTKGDLLAATAAATVARLGVGADGEALLADSSQTTGLRWGTPSASTTKYEPLTSGASSAPELVFTADGRCIMVPVAD